VDSNKRHTDKESKHMKKAEAEEVICS